ncbi:hypothetical protein FACS1894189_4480 [Planctomycetales bacterium]|nr:hypothetical protein FACS1894189_4480 [Planctomycetales bacterium]
MQDENIIKWVNWQFVLRAVCASLLIPVTVACTGLTIFCANMGEVSGTFQQLLPLLGLFISIVAVLLFCVQLPFVSLRRQKWFIPLNAFLLGIGILLWVQGNVFAWNFGVLDGSSMDWSRFRLHAWGEVLAYLVILGAVFRYRLGLSQYAVYLTCVLSVVQILPITDDLFRFVKYNVRDRETWKQYEYTFEGLFDYSKDTDVHLIVLDEFGTSIFDKLTAEDESIQETFCDFSYFPRCICDTNATDYSIPQILTGRDVNLIIPYTEFFAEIFKHETLFDVLAKNNYQCHVCSSAPTTLEWDGSRIANIRECYSKQKQSMRQCLADEAQLIELTLFRLLPTHFKPVCFENFGKLERSILPNNTAENTKVYLPTWKIPQDEVVWEKMKSTEWHHTPGQKQFKFLHMRGSHSPFRLNELAQPEKSSRVDAALKQSAGCLRIIKDYLRKLKEKSAYDNSLIVIMADHGFRRYPETCFNAASGYHPLLLVKKPQLHQATLRVNDAPVHIKDTMPAILTELGLERPANAFSWFEMPQDIAAVRNQDWEKFWKDKANSVAVSPSVFSGSTEKLDQEIELPRKYVIQRNDSVHVEFMGGTTDEVGQSRTKNIMLALADANEKICRYTVLLPCEYSVLKVHGRKPLENIFTAVSDSLKNSTCWASKGVLDFHGVADGEYELVVLLPGTAAGKENKFARLDRYVIVANGLAQTVSPLPQQGTMQKLMQAERPSTVR